MNVDAIIEELTRYGRVSAFQYDCPSARSDGTWNVTCKLNTTLSGAKFEVSAGGGRDQFQTLGQAAAVCLQRAREAVGELAPIDVTERLPG